MVLIEYASISIGVNEGPRFMVAASHGAQDCCTHVGHMVALETTPALSVALLALFPDESLEP